MLNIEFIIVIYIYIMIVQVMVALEAAEVMIVEVVVTKEVEQKFVDILLVYHCREEEHVQRNC